MLTSWTNSVERTSIPFSTLPASAPASAALAMLAVRLQPIPHPPQISLDFKGVPFDWWRLLSPLHTLHSPTKSSES
jgi:hypothetical protein